MQGHPRYSTRDPNDLGDIEAILRRLDSRIASTDKPSVVSSVQPPVSGHSLLENLVVKVVPVLGALGVMLSVGFGAGMWSSNAGLEFKRITDRLDKIDRRFETQDDRFADRLAFVFTDYCRRTEPRNPNWVCADPIIAPIESPAGRIRFRPPSGD